MFINVMIFAVIGVLLAFGIKSAWQGSKKKKIIMVVLGLPILAFTGLVLLQMNGINI